eukprot:128465_1
MASVSHPLSNSSHDTGTQEHASENTNTNELLNTSSEFNPATPVQGNPMNSINTNKTVSTPTMPSPSIPNSAFRNLNISTPVVNTEKKEMEDTTNTSTATTAGSDLDSLIRDDHEYIATIDNKRLQKIAQIDPNKSYKRIQVQNLTKLKTTIRGTINNMMERKRKKLLDNKKHSSDKQEADDTEHEAIPNEHKLEIIEKALNACYTQLMYYNKLFLNPVGVPNTAQIEAKQVNDERRKRINQMKQKIEDKRKILIQRIQTLNALRKGTEEMTVNVPMDIRHKMMQNNEDCVDKQMEMDEDTKAKTEHVLAMIHGNKKKKMIELKAKFEELKENEVRLRQRAERIDNDEQKYGKYMELKRKNEQEMQRMKCNGDQENMNGKHARMSVASSISSTIHAQISPSVFNKFCVRSLDHKLSFPGIIQSEVDG